MRALSSAALFRTLVRATPLPANTLSIARAQLAKFAGALSRWLDSLAAKHELAHAVLGAGSPNRPFLTHARSPARAEFCECQKTAASRKSRTMIHYQPRAGRITASLEVLT